MEDNATERSGSGEPVEFRRSPKKAAVSGWIGSVLEYYDFTIYASAAALVFPVVFFPKGNATVAVVASLATYAVGYLARPIGAVVLGHWGDRHGRKNVLVLCMVAMGARPSWSGCCPRTPRSASWPRSCWCCCGSSRVSRSQVNWAAPAP